MSFYYDILYSLRLFAKKPGFTFLSLFTIALGLATLIVTASIVYHAALEPIKYGDGPELQSIVLKDEVGYRRWSRFDAYSYNYIKNNSTTLTVLGAAPGGDGDGELKYDGATVFPQYAEITPALLSHTNIQPVLGRLFSDEDAQPGAQAVTLLGYSTWQNVFSADPEIIGESVNVNGGNHTIIGVMPEGFEFPLFAEIWLPLRIPESALPGGFNRLQPVVATFKEGVTRDLANLELSQLWAEMVAQYPEHYSQTLSVTTIPYSLIVTDGDVLDLFLILGLVVAMILIFCCVNVGNLLLVQLGERQQEISIRNALGAPRWRMVRQTLLESFLLCLLSVLLALVISWAALKLVSNYFELFSEYHFGGMPFWWSLELDWVSALVAVTATIVMWLLCSLIPLKHLLNKGYSSALTVASNDSTLLLGRNFARTLVFVQVLFTCLLLVSAGSLALVINTISRADYGVDSDQLLSAIIRLDRNRYTEQADTIAYQAELRSELLAYAGVEDVSFATFPGQGTPTVSYDLPGRALASNGDYPRVSMMRIDPNYLETVNVGLLSGRNFSADDDLNSLPVAIIDENFANNHWPNESPLGKQIQRFPEREGEVVTVVGVIPHIVQDDPWWDRGDPATLYLPSAQTELMRTTGMVLMRVDGDPVQYIDVLRQSVHDLDDRSPLWLVRPVAQAQRAGIANYAWVGDLFSFIILATVTLALSGLLAIFSRTIFQRTREFGIRKAVGSDNSTIVSMLSMEGLWHLIPGLVIGVGISVLIVNQLTGYMPDILSYLSLGIVLGVTTIALIISLAMWIPSRRVLSIEPGDALHYE